MGNLTHGAIVSGLVSCKMVNLIFLFELSDVRAAMRSMLLNVYLGAATAYVPMDGSLYHEQMFDDDVSRSGYMDGDGFCIAARVRPSSTSYAICPQVLLCSS